MRKALIASGVTLVVGTAFIGSVYQGLLYQLYHRFPNYDRKVVRETYRGMLMAAFRGELPPAESLSDDDMDALFIKRYTTRNLHAV